MKKQIFSGIPSGAYFVKEPKIVLNKPLSNQLDIEHITDEPLDVVKRRLKYNMIILMLSMQEKSGIILGH